MIRLALIIILMLIVITLMPAVVWSQPYSNPDTTEIEDVYIFRHMLEANDTLLIARYNISYGNTSAQPAEPVDVTFDVTYAVGASTLSNVTIYPFFNMGYARGLVAIYWASDDADIPTWNSAGNLTLAGDAGYFASPPTDTYLVSSADYSTYSSPADIREDLRQWTIDQLLFVELDWNNWYADQGLQTRQVDLLQSIPPDYIILSATGESYLSLVIDNFYSMCPNLYYLQMSALSHAEGNWTLTQQLTWEAQHQTDYIGNATAAASDLMGGIGQIWVTTFVSIMIAVGLTIVCQWKWQKADIGLLIGYTIIILATPEGFMHAGIMALGTVIAVLIIVHTFFWGRSTG